MRSNKTFYLWDLANTLFPEKWNKKKSGFESYNKYVESLGFNLKNISPRDYERAYEIPYKEGLFDLKIAKGFKKTLTWTKNNIVFTTGNKEQIDWRAENFIPRYGFDIREYLKEIHSTFDFGNTNKKTLKMLVNLIEKKRLEGFSSGVYTDDNIKNCYFFLKASKHLKTGFIARAYHILPDTLRCRQIKKNLFQIGSLLQLLENEKSKYI